MRFVVNTLPLLTPLTGAGYYIYQICNHLQQIDPINDYTYFYGYYSKFLRSPEKSSSVLHRAKEVLRKAPFLGTALKYSRGALTSFGSPDFDLYFEPHFIPLDIKARHRVVSILDFSFALFPEWHPKDKVKYFQKHFWEKIKKADRIICISDFIRNEAIQKFGFPPEQLTTIHLGFDRQIFKPYPPTDLLEIKKRYRLPDQFILFVGTIEPRKNLKNLLQAYRGLNKFLRKEYKIVLVGLQGWKNREIQIMVDNLREDLLYLGYVPENELGKIYNLARLFVYPSFYEGFGLPPLEAMACGCPVIVSDVASLPEVCRTGALYINPHDVESIIAAMERILKDESLRNILSKRGLERARFFGWEKTAKKHLKAFEEVLSE